MSSREDDSFRDCGLCLVTTPSTLRMTYMQFRLPRPACTEALWCSIPHIFKRGAGSAPLLPITFCFVLLSIKVTIPATLLVSHSFIMLVTHTEPESGETLKSVPLAVVLYNMSPTPHRVAVLPNPRVGHYIYKLLNVASLDLAERLRCLRLWIQWLKMIYSAVQPYPQEV